MFDVNVVMFAENRKCVKQSIDASGYDIHANENVSIHPQERALVKTGLRISLPKGFEAQIRSRSGLTLKQGLIVLNGVGTIDADYRGEIGVILYNAGHEVAHIVNGMRIAQMVICELPKINLAWVKDFSPYSETERGESGFGSTGCEPCQMAV